MVRLLLALALVALVSAAVWLLPDRERPMAPASPARAGGERVTAGGEPVLRGPGVPVDRPIEAAPAVAAKETRTASGAQDADASAPLRLRLLDVRTGEPVPRFVVRTFTPAGRELQMVSDDDGLACSPDGVPAGAYSVQLVDHPAMRRRDAMAPWVEVEHRGDPRAAPLVQPVGVGPTYLLDIEHPEELAPDVVLASLHPPGSAVHLPDDRHSSPVRAHRGQPWVRFAESVAEPLLAEGPAYLELHVYTRSEGARGSARLAPTWGVHAGVVALRLLQDGQITVRVHADDGEPAEQAGVRLVDQARDGAPVASSSTDSAGTAVFGRLGGGAYGLLVSHGGALPTSLDAALLPGEHREIQVWLTSPPMAGPVAGRVFALAQVGEREPGRRSLEVHLSGSVGRPHRKPVDLRPTADGRWAGEFRFDDLPRGRYRVWLRGPGAFWPSSLDADAPSTDLVFEELPESALLPVRVRAVDARSGESIGHAQTWSAEDRVRRLPRDADVELVVLAPAHAPARLSSGDLREEQGALTATVALEPGWGGALLLRDAHGQPLAGVELRIDGARAALSDAQGLALLAAEQPPAELRAAGWTPWPPTALDTRALHGALRTVVLLRAP